MKKVMHVLYVFNLILVGGLFLSSVSLAQKGASAAAAAGLPAVAPVLLSSKSGVELAQEGADFGQVIGQQNEAKDQAEPMMVSGWVLEAIIGLMNNDNAQNNHFYIASISKWLAKNSAHKNATLSDFSEQNTFLMYLLNLVDNYPSTIGEVLTRLLNYKPDTLARNNQGEDIFDLNMAKLLSPAPLKTTFLLDVLRLAIEQGVDVDILIKKIKDRFKRQAGYEYFHPRQGFIGTSSSSAINMVMQILENEQKDPMHLKAARYYLAGSAPDQLSLLPHALGAALAPSDSRLLAIKHALQDNDPDQLWQALGYSQWLELKDKAGYTPLLYAAYINRPDMVRFLICNGANLDAKTNDGADLSHIAKLVGQDYQKLIVESRLERQRIIESAKQKELEQKEIEKQQLFKNIKEWSGGRPYDSSLVNTRDENGYTPLMLAASLDRMWWVIASLDHKADASLTDSNGNTALHLAILNNHFRIANKLLENIDQKIIGATNDGGFTAYDFALKHADKYKDDERFKQLMETFKKHGYPKN